MRAVVYIRLPDGCALTDYEAHKIKMLERCQNQGYTPVLMIGLCGSAERMEPYGWDKLLQLADRKLVDVIVTPDARMLAESEWERVILSDELAFHGVRIDCRNPTFMKTAGITGIFRKKLQA